MNKMSEKKKDMLAWGCLGITLAGILMGFVSKYLVFGTFTAGTWLCFIAFIASLSAVKDHGSNRLAACAFLLSFLCVCITAYMGSGY